jgi:DNA-binding MarR family transcriptional regulator
VANVAPKDVRDLLMYRLARIATIADRSGQLNISRRFGLTLGAWRVLGVIHAFAPITLTGLAGELYLDKGQLSRSISDLIDSGLVRRAAGQRNRRQTFLELTAEGVRLHDRILPFVAGRNARIMQPLSAAERADLFRLLDKVMTAVTASFEELFGPQPKRPRKPATARSARRSGMGNTAKTVGASLRGRDAGTRQQRPPAD